MVHSKVDHDAPFLKCSGAGNDFLLFELASIPKGIDAQWIKRACNRQEGVGADGVLFCGELEPQNFWLRIFNCDASSAAMCGNGVRCAAHYLARSRGIPLKKVVYLHLPHSIHAAYLNRDLGPSVEVHTPAHARKVALKCAGITFQGHIVDTGVPHFVVSVAEIGPKTWRLEDLPLMSWGPQLRHHATWPNEGYPQGVNVTFVEPKGDESLAIRTFERGVESETRACGTGAAAAAWVVGGLERGKDSCEVEFPSKQRAQMHLTTTGDHQRLWQTGPVHYPFYGAMLAPFAAKTQTGAGLLHQLGS